MTKIKIKEMDCKCEKANIEYKHKEDVKCKTNEDLIMNYIYYKNRCEKVVVKSDDLEVYSNRVVPGIK